MINASPSRSHSRPGILIVSGYRFNMAIWHRNGNCPSVTVHLSPFLRVRVLNESHVLNDILQSAFGSIFLNENKRERTTQV